tara:strand:- start:142 stop:519 length:378 start_codon:yes stop_codon:yes gene_type:complete
MNSKNSFPKKLRLNDSLIIREVFNKGEYKSLGPIGVKFRKIEIGSSLFSISVQKKVGNSPFRNRIKRLLREAVRLEKSHLICSFEVCFFVSNFSKRKFDYQLVLDKVKFLFEYLNNEFCNENDKK